jgi:prepilin-type processing-associated H-X9-DG protein
MFLPMVTDLQRYWSFTATKARSQANQTRPFVWPYLLLKYAKGDAGIFNCPSAPREAEWDGHHWLVVGQGSVTGSKKDYLQATFSYAYNDWGVSDFQDITDGYSLGLGPWYHTGLPDMETSFRNRRPLPAGRVVQPSSMIAVVDSNSDGYWDPIYDPTFYKELETNDDGMIIGQAPGDRHNKGANVLFCDGHAESWRYPDLLGHTDVKIINGGKAITTGTYENRNPRARHFNRDNKPHYDLYATQ